MSKNGSGSLQREGVEAFMCMEEALQLLDRCEQATAIGAQLDLAICRLQEVLIGAGVDPPARETRGDPSL